MTMSMTVVFAMMASASTMETSANVKILNPDFGDTFRSDATLGFMRSQLRREDPFAEASRGPNYDSKKAQKAAAKVLKNNKQEAQPGPNNVAKKAQEDAAKEQEQAQQGPGYDSKKAQKAAAKVAKDNQQEAQQAPNLPEAPEAPNLEEEQEEAQQGVAYDSKKAQKAAAKVAKDNQQEAPQAPKLPEAQQAPNLDGSKEQEEAQQGPNHDSKKAQKAAAKVAKDNQQEAGSDKDPLQAVSDGVAGASKSVDKFLDKVTADGGTQSKQAKQPVASDDKDVSSVSGCKNFPRGWEDSKGNDCEDYDEGHFCDRRGGEDEGWLDEWGTLDSAANKGFSATQACCVCGGGHREFQVGAAGPSPAAAPSPASPAALQSQGFSGQLVEHVEGKTMTGDWGREFGPKAGHKDVKSICMDHPGNEWCELHGYYDIKSGACSKSMVAIFAAIVVACLQ